MTGSTITRSMGGSRAVMLWVPVVLLVCMLHGCQGSRGDENTSYRWCVRLCTEAQKQDQSKPTWLTIHIPTSPLCSSQQREENRTHSIPRSLGMDTYILETMKWDCSADCRYRCMWELEGKAEPGREVNKYFGKWPFVRVMGMQEPASVFLSMLNLVANALCLVRLRQFEVLKCSAGGEGSLLSSAKLEQGSRLEKRRRGISVLMWKIHFLLASNAWIWSSVFHSRDTSITERLDYFSAGLIMVYDLFLSACKVLPCRAVVWKWGFGVLLAVMYSRHMYYMHFIQFNYGYHVGLCVAIGVLQSIGWTTWCLMSEEGKAHPGRRYLLTFVLAVNVAVLLEVFDFPPFFWVLDAHALWHLATVPLVFLWFAFVEKDLVQSGHVMTNPTSTAGTKVQ